MKKILNYCLAALVLVCAQTQAAPILQIEDGILTGAKYVDVAGSYYDVEFLDGTCIALFNGCNDSTDFAFTTQTTAHTASQALLDQVFIDGPTGAFDTQWNLTRGCSWEWWRYWDTCMVATPYGLEEYEGKLAPLGTYVINYGTPYQSTFDYINESIHLVATAERDLGNFFWSTYARWTPSEGLPPIANAVPEPGILACLGGGLLGAFVGRQKRPRWLMKATVTRV